ncbi:hypothetical protein ACFYYN_27145 [Streptomyces sp. NPDC001902]
MVDPDAEQQRKHQTRVGLVTVGAAALVGIVVAIAGGGDGTTPPPGGTPCHVVNGSLECGPGLPGATGYQPAQDWRTAFPSYRPTYPIHPTYLPSLLPVPSISFSLRPLAPVPSGG